MQQKFTKIALPILAEQFQGDPKQLGVCVENCDGHNHRAHVHTMHEGQTCALILGDWVVPEPDGVHFYPIKDEVFRRTYKEG